MTCSGVPPSAGTILDGKYRLEGSLGEGGTGVVWAATHVGLGKHVAVKLLSPAVASDVDHFVRFRREAEALGRLAHEHVVRVTDFGVDPAGAGTPYLVMEHVAGATLDVFAAGAALDPDVALAIVRQMAAAVDAAHVHGVLHGDLSPANVLVDTEGAHPHVTVIDFGLATLDDAGERPSRGLHGTVAYLAPEVVRGAPPTRASDMYALGAIAYELFTGACAGTVPPDDGIRSPRAARPPASSVNPMLPPAFDAILSAVLSPAAADRPLSAGRFAEALERAWAGHARRRWLAREAPRRCAAALVVAALMAGAEGPIASLPVIQRLEHLSNDLRLTWMRRSPPDSRIAVVTLDEAALASDRTALGERGEQAGQVIEQVFASGARGVGVDLLLPRAWADAPTFGSALLAHADALVLAAAATGERAALGTEVLSPALLGSLGAVRAERLFGYVNQRPDLDGVVRTGAALVRDDDGRTHESLAGRLAALAGAPCASDGTWTCEAFPIDYSTEWHRIPHVSWQRLLDGAPVPALHGRIVLIGANFQASGDMHRVPRAAVASGELPGVFVQALMLDTLLRSRPLRQPAGAAGLAVGVGAAALVALTAILGAVLVSRRTAAIAASLSGAVLWVGIAMLAASHAKWMLPVVPVLATWIVAACAGVVLRWTVLSPFSR